KVWHIHYFIHLLSEATVFGCPMYEPAVCTIPTTDFATTAEFTRWANCRLTAHPRRATALAGTAPTRLTTAVVTDYTIRWATAIGKPLAKTWAIMTNLIGKSASAQGAFSSSPKTKPSTALSAGWAPTTANNICAALS